VTATAVAALAPSLAAGSRAGLLMRSATPGDADAIQAVIDRYQAQGRLLPRHVDEIRRHAARFLVVEDRGEIAGCAELAPLSAAVAEVRSLVLDERLRGLGLGRLLVEALTREARMAGFGSICAFTHEPAYFARLGFSLVPHAWLPEKIAVDCVACPLFRRCGQAAMRLRLADAAVRPAGAAA
jgi:amino-acid N-acetyltransferase